jgi:hypothetical protein
MPVIAAYPDPIRAYVRVETNWADTPAVDFVKILRVDSVTGVCTPLRPYICFDGDYLALSCGHAIFWDTEVPLDRQVFYVAQGLGAPCISNPIIVDTFTRTVAAGGWGTADSGQVWTTSGGVATDYSVSGGFGRHSLGSVNAARRTIIDGPLTNVDIRALLAPGVVATGAAIDMGVAGRFMDASNFYLAEARFETAGTVTARIRKNVAGVFTTLTSVATGITYTAATQIDALFHMHGSTLSLKLWDASAPEPAAFTTTTTDTSFPSGGAVAFRTILAAGNTNTLPVVVAMDNLYVSDPCAPCVPVTAETPPLTIGSDGKFRLKDPVRPCRDLVVPLCFDQVASADCLPGSGVFFASMATESFATNSMSVNPTNAEFPIAISRTRRGVTSVLTLVTRTFADRDELKLITKPGSPLLFQGPPQYGIPDRYMDVGETDFERGLTDHKFQVRVATLPHVEVARVAGPTLGVCGSRLKDLCDTFSTWQEIVDAGLNWDDLVRGRAGQPNPTVDFRTWDDVLAEFADWNAVNNGTRTWYDLEVGD